MIVAIAGMAHYYALNAENRGSLAAVNLKDEQVVEAFTRIMMDGIRGPKRQRRNQNETRSCIVPDLARAVFECACGSKPSAQASSAAAPKVVAVSTAPASAAPGVRRLRGNRIVRRR